MVRQRGTARLEGILNSLCNRPESGREKGMPANFFLNLFCDFDMTETGRECGKMQDWFAGNWF
jgi:hypothetical protein